MASGWSIECTCEIQPGQTTMGTTMMKTTIKKISKKLTEFGLLELVPMYL